MSADDDTSCATRTLALMDSGMRCSRHRKYRDNHRTGSKDTSAVNADGVSTVADAVPADQQQQRNDKDAATGSESSSSESSVSESDRRHRHRRRSSRRYVVYLQVDDTVHSNGS